MLLLQLYRRPRRWLSLVVLVWLGCCLTSPASAADAVATLKQYLTGLNSLSADFRQITLAAGGEQIMEARGQLYLRRPGRMRWEYRPPNEQLILADGKRVYVEDKELNQVSHRSQAAALEGTPAELLVSDRPIEQMFKLREFDRGDERDWVELRPKSKESQVVRLQVGFVGGKLDTLVMEDRFGQLTRFIFTKVRRNPALAASLFQFEQRPGGDFLQMD
ncbi:outer membrane lipoprotein chaperone LolA [Rhodoferax sp. 4810]|uniref:Outer-membrane lipoprotein carrier protein n=1 Tax=Thiospirillum jenense TaxID=1653858 RepID=A0A839HC70_9GAMM|nr:outer membrane lipoprotein chaperone LolA [Thiospirillum jenense]MBB1073079.1 outer membrane lipoprotein chaperone LolA [Rhodoferax jenense]MBB1125026.1 outer membrane lipoprotein chaperone LolA [Thiospirillum jenense]